MARLTALVCLLAALLTIGCNGARETDDVAFVVSVGVDAAPGGQLSITYRLANPSALGGEAGKGGEGGKGGEQPTSIITITAPSLAVARDLLNSQVARLPSMAHVKVFIVGEELARKGIGEVVMPLMRFREFRSSMFIFVAHDTTAEKVIRANKPVIEKLPTRWIEGMMATAAESGYYPSTFLHDFYISLKGGSGSPYAVLMGLNPLQGESRPEAGKAQGEKTEEFLPGSVPLRGGNPVLLVGTALFRGDKLVGKLTNEETRMLDILNGEFRRGYLTVQDPLLPASGVNIQIRPGRPAKITASMADGHPVFDIDVMLEGEITAIGSGVNYEAAEYKQLLEEQISTVIRQDMLKMIQYCQQVGADPINFGKYFRPYFRTYQEFRQFDFDSKYPAAEMNVKVTTQLRRTGQMRLTAPIRDRE